MRAFLAGVAVLLTLNLLATLGGRAVSEDVLSGEAASAKTRPTSSETAPPTYQGWTIRTWARKAAQARRDANARKLVIRRLRAEMKQRFVPWHWERIGWCESRHSFYYNGSSGFDGWVQFHPTTWSDNRLPFYPAYAYQASPFQQLVVAEIVLSRQGWRAWPACSQRMGLR